MHHHYPLSLIKPVFWVFLAATGACHAEQWTGFHAGVSLGDRFASSDWNTSTYSSPNGELLPFSSNPHANIDDHNVIWGGYAGYTWQLSDAILLGGEITMRDGENRKSLTTLPGTSETNNPSPFGFSTITANKNWDTSVRARLGYLATPGMQIYGLVGLSIEQLDLSINCPKDTNICNPFIGGNNGQHSSNAFTQVGWTLGMGSEFALTSHILARIEYSYADYGRQYALLPYKAGESFGMSGYLDSASHTFSAGIAYKF